MVRTVPEHPQGNWLPPLNTPESARRLEVSPGSGSVPSQSQSCMWPPYEFLTRVRSGSAHTSPWKPLTHRQASAHCPHHQILSTPTRNHPGPSNEGFTPLLCLCPIRYDIPTRSPVRPLPPPSNGHSGNTASSLGYAFRWAPTLQLHQSHRFQKKPQAN